MADTNTILGLLGTDEPQDANTQRASTLDSLLAGDDSVAPGPKLQPEAPPPGPPQWSDLPGNIVPSAINTGKAIAQPFLHPVDTAKGVYSLATSPKARSRVAQFYKDRYGGLDKLHDTLITDPVGAVTDIATVLTVGGAGLAKVPGIIGKVGEIANTAGRVIDPISNAGRLAVNTAKGAGTLAKAPIAALGLPTAVGPATTLKAFDAGVKGESAFLDNINKRVPQEAVLDDLQAGIKRLHEEASGQYQADMNLPARQADMTPIVKAWQDFKASKTAPNGEWYGTSADKARLDRMWEDIDKYAGTGAGNADWLDLDKLKQRIRSEYYGESPDMDRAVTEVTNAVKQSITKVVPEYQDAMGKYSDAMGTLSDIRKTLSQNKTAALDTQLAKLRNSMAGTSRGDRAGTLVDKIEAASGQPIKAALAGQRMSGWMPLKDHPVVQRALGAAAAYGGITHPAALAAVAKAAPYMALSSPRIMGNMLYGAGAAARYAKAPFLAAEQFAPSAGAARATAMAGLQAGRVIGAEDDEQP